MNDQALKELLDKYLSGDLSSGEEARLEAWLAEKEATGKVLFDEDSPDLKDTAYEKELFDRITRELDLQKKAGRRKWWAVAAAVLLVSCLGAAGYMVYQNRSSRDADRHIAKQAILAALDSSTWKSVANTGTRTRKLLMADGSKISLYPGSEIRFDSALYNVRDRKLYLSGKGFFDVAHEAAKPFVVYSRGISTMALGTAFTISAYGYERKIKIDLIQGKVRIRKEPPTDSARHATPVDNAGKNGFKDIILQAGEYFAYDFAAGKTSKGQLTGAAAAGDRKKPSQGDNNVTKAAARSPLIYDRADLSKVLKDMESAYQIHIDYNKNDINAIEFSGSIRPGDSVRHVLKKIGLLNDLQITQEGESRFRIDKLKN